MGVAGSPSQTGTRSGPSVLASSWMPLLGKAAICQEGNAAFVSYNRLMLWRSGKCLRVMPSIGFLLSYALHSEVAAWSKCVASNHNMQHMSLPEWHIVSWQAFVPPGPVTSLMTSQILMTFDVTMDAVIPGTGFTESTAGRLSIKSAPIAPVQICLKLPCACQAM